MQGAAQEDLQPLRPPPELGNGPSEQQDDPLLPAAAAPAAGGSWRDDRGRSTLLINTASVVERVDEQVPPRGRGTCSSSSCRQAPCDACALPALAPPLACLQLLPALYSFVGRSFHADPQQLGALTFSRAVVQALASPLAGVLGHYANRVHVITAGAALWGLMCMLFATANTVAQVRRPGGSSWML